MANSTPKSPLPYVSFIHPSIHPFNTSVRPAANYDHLLHPRSHTSIGDKSWSNTTTLAVCVSSLLLFSIYPSLSASVRARHVLVTPLPQHLSETDPRQLLGGLSWSARRFGQSLDAATHSEKLAHNTTHYLLRSLPAYYLPTTWLALLPAHLETKADSAVATLSSTKHSPHNINIQYLHSTNTPSLPSLPPK